MAFKFETGQLVIIAGLPDTAIARVAGEPTGGLLPVRFAESCKPALVDIDCLVPLMTKEEEAEYAASNADRVRHCYGEK